MTDRRILFHKLLCEILSCPIEGEQCRCYFQPPESIKMNYPAIVYSLDDIEQTWQTTGYIYLIEDMPLPLLIKIRIHPWCRK